MLLPIKALVRGVVRMRGMASTARMFQQAHGTKISRFEMQTNKNHLSITWKNGSTNRYPFFHLRDNCQCTECLHSISQQRLLDTFDNFELDVRPERVDLTPDGKSLAITWPDGHVSEFDAGVLFMKRLPETVEEAKQEPALTSRHVQLWDKSLEGSVPRIPFHDIMREDEALYTWLSSLSTLGLVCVVGAPTESGQVEKLGKRVSYVKTTMHGDTFSVTVRQTDAYDLAYTPRELRSHTDLNYQTYTPGLQMFHCIKQIKSVGGANTFIDGFNAARQLKEQDPEAFRLLTTIPIYFKQGGEDVFGEYFLSSCRPLIMLDVFGRICTINVSEPTRSGFVGVTVDEIEEVYLAYRKFVKILREPRNIVEYKMKEGDIIVTDNFRVLHGRRGYQSSKDDTRTLEGAYMDWDEVKSRLHVLTKSLQ